jgi:transcription-repair coupling factor (superfamily II helicase)
LYKQLDSLKTEEELADYRKMLEDRFGPVPPEVNELLETIRLRWAATTLGFEKLVIKNNKMVANFITDEESDYFNSAVFQGILAKLQTAAGGGRLREKNNKLSLVFENIKTIKDAKKTIESLTY